VILMGWYKDLELRLRKSELKPGDWLRPNNYLELNRKMELYVFHGHSDRVNTFYGHPIDPSQVPMILSGKRPHYLYFDEWRVMTDKEKAQVVAWVFGGACKDPFLDFRKLFRISSIHLNMTEEYYP
jgi:hypothetical protein